MGDKGKRTRWERRISRERKEDDNYVNDNVHIYHSNSIGGNGQDHVGLCQVEHQNLLAHQCSPNIIGSCVEWRSTNTSWHISVHQT